MGYVRQAFGLPAVAAFRYRWACPALAGRTVGKALTGLKVTPRTPRRAALRADRAAGTSVASVEFSRFAATRRVSTS
ncbi:hypothetical protein [Streptomyces albogriseolus]|uniref:hypothetical protein n=1 Tax=Streptomyces albogriseolus TaxID=1887 RepID=UPI0033A7F1B0